MDAYYKSDEFRQVLNTYENILQGNDGFIDAADYADVAEYFLAKGDDQRARKAAEMGVDIFPDSLPPLAVLARIELSANRIAEAKELIERAADKDELEYFYVQAEIMIAEGRVMAAERFLSEIETDDDPDNVALDIVAIYIDHNEFKLARKWLDKVKDRSLPDVQDFEAHILSGEGKYEEGEKVVNELLDDDPYSDEHWNHLASLQYQRADYQASIDSSDFALAIDANNAEALLNKANSFYALRNYGEACRFYEQFLTLRPDNAPARYFYGLALAMLDRHAEAVKELKLSLNLAIEGSKNGDAFSEDLLSDIQHDLAYELADTGNGKEALTLLHEVLQACRDLPNAEGERADLWLSIAKLHLLEGEVDQTLHAFDKAIAESDTPETFVHMTAVVYECGYVDKAYEILAAKLYSKDGYQWNTGHAFLARYAYALGQMDVFRMNVLVAVERNPIEAQQVLYDLYPDGTAPADYPFTPVRELEKEK